MMKKEELERSLASSEEEAAAVRRALAAAERRGNDLSRKLREAEEREAAMHSEQVRLSPNSCMRGPRAIWRLFLTLGAAASGGHDGGQAKGAP